MNLKLTDSDRLFLKKYRSKSTKKVHFVRCTILLNLDKGKSAEEIADMLGIDRSTIYNHHNNYLEKGISEFLSSNYLGSQGKLTNN